MNEKQSIKNQIKKYKKLRRKATQAYGKYETLVSKAWEKECRYEEYVESFSKKLACLNAVAAKAKKGDYAL